MVAYLLFLSNHVIVETDFGPIAACANDISTVRLHRGPWRVHMRRANGSQVVPLVQIDPNAVVLLDDNRAVVPPLARLWVGGGSDNIDRVEANRAAP